jgi:hypothetical protein
LTKAAAWKNSGWKEERLGDLSTFSTSYGSLLPMDLTLLSGVVRNRKVSLAKKGGGR